MSVTRPVQAASRLASVTRHQAVFVPVTAPIGAPTGTNIDRFRLVPLSKAQENTTNH